MTIQLSYKERLGDIVRVLPIAGVMSNLGHDVVLNCDSKYSGIFDLVDYCRPPDGLGFDREFDLTIWPRRYQEYRSSGLTWFDFVYADFPQALKDFAARCLGIIKSEVPSTIFPLCKPNEQYANNTLVFASGFSEPTNPAIVWELANGFENPILCGERAGELKFPTIKEYVEAIAGSKTILTVNTSASIVASALKKPYIHLYNHIYPMQDNWQSAYSKQLTI